MSHRIYEKFCSRNFVIYVTLALNFCSHIHHRPATTNHHLRLRRHAPAVARSIPGVGQLSMSFRPRPTFCLFSSLAILLLRLDQQTCCVFYALANMPMVFKYPPTQVHTIPLHLHSSMLEQRDNAVGGLPDAYTDLDGRLDVRYQHTDSR
ncbi:hypothetical protein FB446DRAFT_721189 [Lentinula raphanica]|nr:hypothetical protein FB446DRAFT_721189 [Lentinula raphanica]